MTMRLRDEIRQTRAFDGPEQEAHLSIERTAAMLGHALAEVLKPFGITATQYNVLRILRGAGEAGLCRGAVKERLVAQVPDVTRILDRMEEAGMVERERDTADRRFVTTRITPAGLELLAGLDAPISEAHRRQLGHLGEEKLRTLVELLALARQGA